MINSSIIPGLAGELYVNGEQVGTAVLTGTHTDTGAIYSNYYFVEMVIDNHGVIETIDNGATLQFIGADDSVLILLSPVVVAMGTAIQDGDKLRIDKINILSPVYRKKT